MPVSQDGLSGGGGGDLQPPVQDRLVVCDIQETVVSLWTAFLGWQSLKPLVTSQGSSAVQCPGMLQQRMLTK